MHAPKQRITIDRMAGTRIVANPEAINALVDAIKFADDLILMRFAPDEIYVTPALENTDVVTAMDAHAIVISEGAFSGAWVDEAHAMHLLEMHAEWEMPKERPAFVQGSVAGVATKLYFEEGRVLFAVASPYAKELEERLS